MKKLLIAAIVAVLGVIAGTAIADDAIETPYFVIEAQLAGQDSVGLVPEGLRMDGHIRGSVPEGIRAGATTTGIDYLVMRHDGVGVIDARYIVAGADGVTAAMTIRGFLGEPSPGLLEAMLDPEFEMPDADIPLHGAAWFQTMAPQYAFVNHTVFDFTGTINMVTGLLRLTGRSLAP